MKRRLFIALHAQACPDCYYCEQHAKLGKAAPADKAKKPAEPAKK